MTSPEPHEDHVARPNSPPGGFFGSPDQQQFDPPSVPVEIKLPHATIAGIVYCTGDGDDIRYDLRTPQADPPFGMLSGRFGVLREFLDRPVRITIEALNG